MFIILALELHQESYFLPFDSKSLKIVAIANNEECHREETIF